MNETFRTDKWEGEDEDDDIKDSWDAESDEEKKDESKEVGPSIEGIYLDNCYQRRFQR